MTMMRSLRFLLVLLLILGASRIASAIQPEDLIVARAGSLPILLTAPHGGAEGVPNIPRRNRGTTTTDLRTIELTEALEKHIENALGARPYVVMARFSRKFIDANRLPGDAFDSPDAKPFYDAYHNQIQLFIANIKAQFPQGALLLDIHGQSKDPKAVYRGTGNATTVAALILAHGPAALIGPNSIFGMLQESGYRVFPENTPIGNPPEDKRFNGGYTARKYGSGQPDGIDAIQIEIGYDLRTDPRFTAAFGDAIITFYKTYLTSNVKAN